MKKATKNVNTSLLECTWKEIFLDYVIEDFRKGPSINGENNPEYGEIDKNFNRKLFCSKYVVL